MINRYKATLLSIIALTIATPVLAADVSDCKVSLAISTPPVQPNQRVSFNVTGTYTNNSIVLDEKNASKTIDGLVCSDKEPYLISATLWSTSMRSLTESKKPVGQCILKSGPIILGSSENSVSVVFPYDFICNSNI